jgi:peptidoglycan/LPS O-acetylase OafA/YrhL
MIKDASHTPSQEQSRIAELESLRGLAALLVVFSHMPKWNPALDVSFVNNGYLMVELFFVLSGFVICNAYAEKIEGAEDVARFQLLRLGRLYPVHLLFLLVFVAIEMGKYMASSGLGIDSPNSTPFETNNLSAFFKNVFLVAFGPPTQALTFNYPAWSICAEFFTYLVFALSVLTTKRYKSITFAALALSSLVLLGTRYTFGLDALLKCFAGFFIGCVTATVTKTQHVRVSVATPSIVFAAFILFLQLKPSREFDMATYFLAAVLIASLVLTTNAPLKRALSHPSLTWLGAISYSVYMSHAAIEWGANQIIRFALRKPEALSASGKSTPQLTGLETLLACVGIVAIVLLVSALAYLYIEKPLREKSRRFVFEKMK